MPADGRPHFIYPATDGSTLVGVVVTGTQPFGYVAAVDLAIGRSQRIADVWSPGNPQVSGQYVVWTDQGKLYVYDRVSAKTEQLTIGEAARDLSLSGSIVVWENISQGQTLGIWGYDLATGKDFPVVKTTATTKARKPLVSGRWVVYQSAEYKDGETRIGLNTVNMDTSESFELGRLPNLTYYVPPLYAIDVSWVAWSTYEWGCSNLHLYNLDTHISYKVAVPGCGLDEVHLGNIYHIVVSGSIVLFRGCYQSAGMGYDIERDEFVSVPITRAESQEAAFVGWAFARGQLVWSMTVGPRWQEQTQVYAAPIIRDKP
jgi:tricorn protease-like protein